MSQLIFNPLRPVADVGLPEAGNGITARGKVGVLRPVSIDPSALAPVEAGKLGGVAVPVITIELHNEIAGRHKGINAELPADHVLRFVLSAYAVKHGIARTLDAVRFQCLLFHVHLAQHLGAFRIIIAALKRTVDRCAAKTRDGWRYTKRLPADFTCVLDLIAPLPFVQVLQTTKIMLGFFKPAEREVERIAAPLASYHLAVISFLGVAFTAALTRTKSMLAVNNLAAYWAGMIAGTSTDNATFGRAIYAYAPTNTAGANAVLKRLTARFADVSFIRHIALPFGTIKPMEYNA